MTTASRPISIVIPTHNRRASVQRGLEALSRQSYPRDAIEVIVVADGCTDGTGALTGTWPFATRIIEQPRRGPGAARNRGAAAATGDLLIFLDDDIEPWPGLVTAHAGAHAGEAHRVAIGYLPAELQGRRDFFAIMLRAWWEAMFERMAVVGHRFRYTDLLSGNFSLQRALFAQIGGFDEDLACHEDYELALRLLAAGAQLRFIREAAGWHHEHTTLERALQRKRDEGRADVALAHRHPDLASVLPLSARHAHLTRRGRMLRHFAVSSPAAGDLMATWCLRLLTLLERSRLRTRWRRLLDDLLSYWYWRGVAEALGGQAIDTVRRGPPEMPAGAWELDLRMGLAAAMQRLDERRPDSVRLRVGTVIVGEVAPEPGSEPLQSCHLPGLLSDRFAEPFGRALAGRTALERPGLETRPDNDRTLESGGDP